MLYINILKIMLTLVISERVNMNIWLFWYILDIEELDIQTTENILKFMSEWLRLLKLYTDELLIN